jgi:hypothetical protein
VDKIRSTAIHEAGHAVIAEYLGFRVTNATAVPRGYSLGSVRYAKPLSTPNAGTVFAAGHARCDTSLPIAIQWGTTAISRCSEISPHV